MTFATARRAALALLFAAASGLAVAADVVDSSTSSILRVSPGFDSYYRINMVEARMVTGLYVVPIFVMLCGFAVMARSVLMVLRCLGVMMCSFVWHRGNLSCAFSAREDYGESNGRQGYKNANST